MAEDDGSSDFIDPASDETSLESRPPPVPSDYGSMLNNESLLGSVTTSVAAPVYENGRTYHSWREGRYPFPNDTTEGDRESIRHALFKDLANGRLHLAPIGDYPQKIADLGTGFGEWVVEMGDLYPSASILGLDISPNAPNAVPPNVRFVVDDIDLEEWIHGGDFDYMHTRMVAMFLQQPLRLAATMFENLRPGGWVEFQEMAPRALCDDDTMPPDYCMNRFFDVCRAVLGERPGWDIGVIEHLDADLAAMGFVNVQRKAFRVPIGKWPRDKKRVQHAALFREVLSGLLDTLLLKPMADGAPGMTHEQVADLFQEVREALSGRRVHAYMNTYFVFAQKPPV